MSWRGGAENAGPEYAVPENEELLAMPLMFTRDMYGTLHAM